MRNTFLSLILIAIIWIFSTIFSVPQSGNQNLIENDSISFEVSFDQYLSTLDTIELPFTHSTIGQLPILSENFNQNGFHKFSHIWTIQPLGILFKNQSYISIIDCSMGDCGFSPFIMVYDVFGNKVDSLGPYEKSGFDPGYEAIEYLSIDAIGNITVLDTIKIWDLDELENIIIPEKVKITSGLTKYRILNSGKITKIE
jgi:hypothetical protein